MPLNAGSLMEFTILDSGGGGGVGDGVKSGGEDGGSVDGWDKGGGRVAIHENPCLIN